VGSQGTIELAFGAAGSATVTLSGEHDLDNAGRVATALAAAGTAASVLVDLTASTFIDSSVMRELLAASRRLHEGDGQLELAVPPAGSAVRRALELAGIAPLIPLHEASSHDAPG
jgi:anti-anti-sigma factor